MIFFRYIAIQLVAYFIDMSLFMIILLVELGGPVEANVVAKLSAGFFAFFSHRKFTFQVVQGASVTGQAVRYFLLLMLNVPLASGILAVFLQWMSGPFVAKLIADAICVGLTYLLSKYVIFTKPHSDHGKAFGVDL